MHLQMTLMVVMTLVSTALGHWRFTHENRSSASGPGLRYGPTRCFEHSGQNTKHKNTGVTRRAKTQKHKTQAAPDRRKTQNTHSKQMWGVQFFPRSARTAVARVGVAMELPGLVQYSDPRTMHTRVAPGLSFSSGIQLYVYRDRGSGRSAVLCVKVYRVY